jgi:anaerobic ribonucleoside-triphosphate reductase activating protein
MNVAAVNYNDMVNSVDGTAISVWVCGCPHKCKGCHNPELFDYENKNAMFKVETIKDMMYFFSVYLRDYFNKNGIERHLSILGGEPLSPNNELFTQNLIFLIHTFFPNKKIYLWTGYSLEELKNRYKDSPDMMKTLSYVSLMITDRFDINKRDITLPLRGSSNQRIWRPYSKKIFNKEIVKFKEVTNEFVSN